MTISLARISNEYPQPFLSRISTSRIANGINSTLEIEGSFFTPNMIINSDGFVVNEMEFISDNKIILNVSTVISLGQYDIVFNNGKEAIASSAIEVVEAGEWVDLRIGKTPLNFTEDLIITGIAQEIERNQRGITIVRDKVNFPSNSWGESLGFKDYQFKRGNNTTVEIIFYNYPGVSGTFGLSYMVGLGKSPRDLTSTAQFFQGELLLYFQPPNFIGLLGDSGFLISVINNVSTDFPEYLKLKFTNDATRSAGVFSLYALPTVEDEPDFDDESNLVVSRNLSDLSNAFTLSGEDLFPILLPQSGSRDNTITAFRLT